MQGAGRRQAVTRNKVTILLAGAALLLCAAPRLIAAPGSSGAQFLKIGINAQSSALGGTGAVADGVKSIYLNPAGLAAVQSTEIELSQVLWIEDISYSNISLARKLPAGTIGIGMNYLSMPSIKKYDNNGTRLPDTYIPNDRSLTLSYGVAAGGMTRFGGSVKYISSRIDDVSAQSYALDLGMQQKLAKRLSMGLAVQNIGEGLKFSRVRDPLPLTYKLGGRFVLPVSSEMDRFFDVNHEIEFLTDINYCNDSGWFSNLGMAYNRQFDEDRALSFRGGYRTNLHGLNNDIGFSAGFGFTFKHTVFDYAFSPYGDFGTAHRLSLTLKF